MEVEIVCYIINFSYTRDRYFKLLLLKLYLFIQLNPLNYHLYFHLFLSCLGCFLTFVDHVLSVHTFVFYYRHDHHFFYLFVLYFILSQVFPHCVCVFKGWMGWSCCFYAFYLYGKCSTNKVGLIRCDHLLVFWFELVIHVHVMKCQSLHFVNNRQKQTFLIHFDITHQSKSTHQSAVKLLYNFTNFYFYPLPAHLRDGGGASLPVTHSAELLREALLLS